ncbi:hypothetical protein M406DRAFT_345075 [Cryphonectria parasitica EP155]|uniref:Splicing factor U2AF subunit n=1 Tax=Cryphonectria parasitica (strain ATCC 38755 / EP155) TaxID=660469 RepID=A0A9P4YAD4_CRYP1|nr:uncharacterized protein M406DRAFT_345075 [Cryphonectria parasitica EP155]KAF3769349.1 hypothetical protein M406DRAFT_345075 [Cryphonectria parasitica EP155]
MDRKDGGRHGSSRDYGSSRRDRDDRRDRDRDRRRRSRSPYDSSRRRDAGGEVDSYSSSRNHRDREREDRYSGRRERDWDRDARGGRRDGGGRRDDDRPPRRDRGDLFDDRRRGPRDGGGHFDRERERRRSESPPPKKREPTPDLTDIISVLERKRRLTQWDIKPPGYENVTAEQAKLSGMFPLPGAPRQQAMDPTKLQAFMKEPGTSTVNNASLKPTNSRQAKRLIVSNLPASATEENVLGFFNLQLNGLNVVESTDPCSLAQMSSDRTFALLEFKTAEDATVALALDGQSMEADDVSDAANGAPHGLQIRRPKDYIVPAIVDDPNYEPGRISNIVIDTPNKISVANIPPYLTSEQVLELLNSFGELKAFVLVQDRGTEESRGIAFCEYLDPAATEVAIKGLDGMELGDRHLKVRKASIGITQIASVEMGVNAMSMLAGTTSTDSEVTRVLQLLNMVTPEELMDPDDYEEICEDVRDECGKFGTILELKVPRPSGGSKQSAGIGKIYVKFDSPESATKALKALAGRKFADRTVVTTYFPEENFEVGAW